VSHLSGGTHVSACLLLYLLVDCGCLIPACPSLAAPPRLPVSQIATDVPVECEYDEHGKEEAQDVSHLVGEGHEGTGPGDQVLVHEAGAQDVTGGAAGMEGDRSRRKSQN
jgi:hypothetical protein